MCLKLNKERGWTLVELMIVIVILVVLAVVVIMAFGGTQDKARESATKGSLDALRGAIRNFYADKEGVWPENIDDPSDEFCGKYIAEIPVAKLRKPFRETNKVRYETPATSEGGWLYNSDTGHITVNHPEKDTKGIYYSTY